MSSTSSITFDGFLPRSSAVDPVLRLRGLVTITFFGLDDVIGRKNLMLERATIVRLLYDELIQATDRGNTNAAALVEEMQAPTAPHANCARSFARLFHSDRARATEVAESLRRFLQSRSL